MKDPNYPADAKERAQRILNGCSGQSVGEELKTRCSFIHRSILHVFYVPFNQYQKLGIVVKILEVHL